MMDRRSIHRRTHSWWKRGWAGKAKIQILELLKIQVGLRQTQISLRQKYTEPAVPPDSHTNSQLNSAGINPMKVKASAPIANLWLSA
jgi:hypothetical protein